MIYLGLTGGWRKNRVNVFGRPKRRAAENVHGIRDFSKFCCKWLIKLNNLVKSSFQWPTDTCRSCFMFTSLGGALFVTWLAFVAFNDPDRIEVGLEEGELRNMRINYIGTGIFYYLVAGILFAIGYKTKRREYQPIRESNRRIIL